jgi:hypothetical protein
MHLTKDGGTYTLSGLTARQVGLLGWMADTVLIAADEDSGIVDDASAFYTSVFEGPASIRAREVAAGIDASSELSELDNPVRYAPKDE